MRIVLLTHGGADIVIENLARLSDVQCAGVFIEAPSAPRRGMVEKFRRSFKYDGVSGTAAKFLPGRTADARSASKADPTKAAASKWAIPVIEIDNYHTPESIEKLKGADADLGIIYGTNIVRETVFSIPKLGSVNLHQGLAPHYRGGPPVFWELFNGEKEIGLTVHFVAAKVDTGDIVLQKRLPLNYDVQFGDDFEAFIDAFRTGLRDESARLVADAVERIAAGRYERMPQDTSQGKRYRLPTKKEKDEMRRRLKIRLKRGAV